MRTLIRLTLALAVVAGGLLAGTGAASASVYFPIDGEGSSWSANAIDQWISDVQQYGMQVSYDPDGSATGQQDFIKGLTDFTASDIPFQTDPQDGSAPVYPAAGSYAYMPITSGGTAFMYNLESAGRRVTDLRLSAETLVKIFTGAITRWNDPAIAAENPGLDLPDIPIVPVVRSDGSGTSYVLSQWMIAQYPQLWDSLCVHSGRPANECGPSEFYPTVRGMIAQSGDLGVSAYVAASYADGAIGYVNYSYALEKGFPVVSLENAAGYYTTPTPTNVAVSLEAAKVDTTDVNNPAKYLTENLTGLYTDPDPRTYILSQYSYLILPTEVSGQFSTQAGRTLAAFAYYAMCQGQQEAMAPTLGYSPLPINLVRAAFAQITKIPGAVVQNINIQGCNNPTFTPTGVNKLAVQAPYPPACAKAGPVQCAAGTGGDTAPTLLTGASSQGSTGSTSTGTAGTSPSSGASSTGASSAGTGASSSGTAASSTGGSSAGAAGSTQSVAAANCAAIPGSCPSSGGAAADPTAGDTTSNTADSDTGGTLSAAGDPAPAEAVATALPASNGLGSTQAVAALVVLLVVLLLVAPGLAARRLRRRRT